MKGGTTMWIEKREVKGSPRYVYIERYKSPLTGKYKKVSVTYGKHNRMVVKRATRELEAKIQTRLSKEQQTQDTQLRLSDLRDSFLESYQNRVRPTTLRNTVNYLRMFVEIIGNDVLMYQIKAPLLNDFFDKFGQQHGNGMVRGMRSALRVMFKYAVQHGLIISNPMNNVVINFRDESKKHHEKIENKYLTDEEYHKIIDDCEQRAKYEYKNIFQLMYLTGMRFGEASGLQVNDIIRKDGKTYLRITGSLVWLRDPHRYEKMQGAKTFAGNRDVLLSPLAVKIVNKQAEGKDPDAFLFAYNYQCPHKKDQRPLSVETCDSFLQRCVKRQHIKKHVTTHYFRHTHVSNLADLGVPLHVIQKRVGHRDSEVTRQIYLHVTQNAEQRFEKMINQLDNMS